MLFQFKGRFPVQEIESAARAVAMLLQEEGLDEISELSLSMKGWRGEARCQIVDQRGLIYPICTDWRDERIRSTFEKIILDRAITIKDRPKNKEQKFLAIFLGLDD